MPLYGTLAGLLVASIAAVGIGASVESPRALMTRDDYVEARKSLDAQARIDLGQCRQLEGRDRSLCRVSANGQDRVRKAELEARYRGTVNAAAEAAAVKAKHSARTERARALADARPANS